ncbi:hypothetical protein [Morganella morganii]|uniref:hypothetical protein n=1 Tax=Morganella morganii TaxID=582 RepID=UPI0013C92D90|nr:hypothetical protein [Morganella morganii]NGE95147.1 hypothetical protein [Morganella morganii]
MSKLFYAVCDLSNDKYTSVKAIFWDKEQAELMVENNKEVDVFVVLIYLEDARQ